MSRLEGWVRRFCSLEERIARLEGSSRASKNVLDFIVSRARSAAKATTAGGHKRGEDAELVAELMLGLQEKQAQHWSHVSSAVLSMERRVGSIARDSLSRQRHQIVEEELRSELAALRLSEAERRAEFRENIAILVQDSLRTFSRELNGERKRDRERRERDQEREREAESTGLRARGELEVKVETKIAQMSQEVSREMDRIRSEMAELRCHRDGTGLASVLNQLVVQQQQQQQQQLFLRSPPREGGGLSRAVEMRLGAIEEEVRSLRRRVDDQGDALAMANAEIRRLQASATAVGVARGGGDGETWHERLRERESWRLEVEVRENKGCIDVLREQLSHLRTQVAMSAGGETASQNSKFNQ